MTGGPGSIPLSDDQQPPPPPSVFGVLIKSGGVTGSPSPNAANAGRIHVRHARARLVELLEGDSPSAQRHAEAMCAELERGADPNELASAEAHDDVEQVGATGSAKVSVLQAACTRWWTSGCDYDPRPVVAALLRHGADPNTRCDTAMGPGAGFLRSQERRRGRSFHSQWAGHTALWQVCALSYYSTRVSSPATEHCWSPADVWLDAQRNARSSEEREELASINGRRRRAWDSIRACHPPSSHWC